MTTSKKSARQILNDDLQFGYALGIKNIFL
jgi:hypothetical protein